MKRMTLILLAFMMLCSCTLAETAEKTVYDYHRMVTETPCKTGYKVEGRPYLDIFPAGDNTADDYLHFNVV